MLDGFGAGALDEGSSSAWRRLAVHFRSAFELQVGGARFETAQSYNTRAPDPFDRHVPLSRNGFIES